MTEKEATFCFQGHDDFTALSEFNINKYGGRIICLGEKYQKWGKGSLKYWLSLEPITKEK